MALTMLEVASVAERPQPSPTTGEPRELRCRRKVCAALLARVVGATLVCLDGTRVGPVAAGMVVARTCPRCKTRNLFWL